MTPNTEIVSWDSTVATMREFERQALAGERQAFESHAGAALASYDQVGVAGLGGAHDGLLIKLAADAGMAYKTLEAYRPVALWLGDSLGAEGISGLSVASEARKAKRSDGSPRWATGAEWLAEMETAQLPAGREAWTVDAHREYRGEETTRPRPGEEQRLPRGYSQASKYADRMAAGNRDIAEAVFNRLNEKLHEVPIPEPKRKLAQSPIRHPETKPGNVARKCEKGIGKAFDSAVEEPEAVAAFLQVRALIHTHDLVVTIKVGVGI